MDDSQLVGGATEHRFQGFSMNKLKWEGFDVAVLPCPHVQDEARCILIVKAALSLEHEGLVDILEKLPGLGKVNRH